MTENLSLIFSTLKKRAKMELICRILKQHPLQTREYNNKRTGQKETFVSVGLNLASGTDTLYAEITGDNARRISTDNTQYAPDYYYKVSLSAQAESWTDQQGQQRNGTRLYIKSIAVL